MKTTLSLLAGVILLVAGFVLLQVTTTTSSLYYRLCLFSITTEVLAIICAGLVVVMSEGRLPKALGLVLIVLALFNVYEAATWMMRN
jgi:hypothetical protein